MEEIYERVLGLIGSENLLKLSKKKIIIFGLGGVGGYVLESLARSGIKDFTIVDFDKVEPSNLNRQIISNLNTIGKYKVDVFRDRIKNINKGIKVKVIKEKLTRENLDLFFKDESNNLIYYDYIVDAIDDLKAKEELIKFAFENNYKIISSMATGNRLSIEKLSIDKLKNTSYCPISKILRKNLKGYNREILNLDVLYSKETKEDLENFLLETGYDFNGQTKVYTAIFTPAAAGLLIGEFVFKKLLLQ